MSSEPGVIRSNDRIFAVGKTGTGKTAAVLKLVWEPLDRVVFMDVKGREYRNLRAPVLTTLDDVREALNPSDDDEPELTKFCYRPRSPDLDVLDEVCRLVYQHGNMHLIVDELKSIYHGGGLVEHHNLLLTNGRDAGVGFTGTTQRPKRVPLEAISESEHLFAFQLKTGDDRDRLAEVIGRDHADRTRKLDRYHYLYDHDLLDAPVACEPLDL